MAEEGNNKVVVEDGVALVKEYKLTAEKVEGFVKKLEDIKKEPVVEEVNQIGEAKVTTEELLKKSQELAILMLEMNITMMKNVVSAYKEHELEREIQNVQMTERLASTFKQFGIDEKTLKRMFRSEE